MAKKKEEVVTEAPPAATPPAAEAAPAAAPPKAAPVTVQGYLPKIGDMVHFFRKQNTGNASKHETLAAMVIGYPPGASNFQLKDYAVRLKVFTDHGDQIKEAMFDSTGEKKEHRWGPKQ